MRTIKLIWMRFMLSATRSQLKTSNDNITDNEVTQKNHLCSLLKLYERHQALEHRRINIEHRLRLL